MSTFIGPPSDSEEASDTLVQTPLPKMKPYRESETTDVSTPETSATSKSGYVESPESTTSSQLKRPIDNDISEISMKRANLEKTISPTTKNFQDFLSDAESENQDMEENGIPTLHVKDINWGDIDNMKSFYMAYYDCDEDAVPTSLHDINHKVIKKMNLRDLIVVFTNLKTRFNPNLPVGEMREKMWKVVKKGLDKKIAYDKKSNLEPQISPSV